MSSTAQVPHRPVWVLDFDGVICDGSTECALVTWNGHFELPLADFGRASQSQIPATFLQRFRDLRGYARHLEHFLVPIIAGETELATQQEFDTLFAAIPSTVRHAFTRRVEAYRDAARRQHRARWLSYHTLYTGVGPALRARDGDWYIVTAKDAASVQEVLAWHQIKLDPAHIYSEQTDKRDALQRINDQDRSRTTLFVDDSLANVMRARAAGYEACWADWGFHTPEQAAAARADETPTFQLADFCHHLGDDAGSPELSRGAA